MDHEYDLTRADGTFVRITPKPNPSSVNGGTWLLTACNADGNTMRHGTAYYTPDQVIGQVPASEVHLFRSYLNGLLVKSDEPSPKLFTVIQEWVAGYWDAVETDLEALRFRVQLSRLAFRTLDELDRRATFDSAGVAA